MDFGSLYSCISTYDSLIDKGEVLINFVDEFVERIAKPLNKTLTFNATGKRIRPKEYEFNHENWEKFKSKFIDGQIREFKLWDFDHKLWEETGEPFSLQLDVKSNSDLPDTASLLEFSIEKSVFSDKVPIEIQENCVEIIETLNNMLDCVGGFITWDYIGCEVSAHERYMGLSYFMASRSFNRYFRGYSWGNFLSPKHVELLGDHEKVEKEAPVYLVKRLENGGMYLQLTENVNQVLDEDLRKLKLFLKSILPPRRFETEPRSYQFMRVIKDED